MENNDRHTATFIDVLLPLAVPLYTYEVPESLKDSITIGSRVIVQLGQRKMYTAIVYAIHHKKPDVAVVKSIESVLDEAPIVTQKQIQLWDWMADYYMCTRGEIMKAALPSGLKLESEAIVSANPNFDCMTLNEADRQVYSVIEKNESLSLLDLAKALNKKSVTIQVQKLVKLNAVIISETISNQYKPKVEAYVRLAGDVQDKSFIDQAFAQIARAAKQQSFFLWLLNETILHKEVESFAVAKQDALAQTSSAILAELAKKNIIVIENKEVSRFAKTDKEIKGVAELSNQQQTALQGIHEAFSQNKFCLLHGVTSSGKTEVYIHLIQELIDSGKQVLYLLPEIALTSQIINRLRDVFGYKVGIYHSKFSDNERVEVWNNILQNNENSYRVILGVRSSIFLPFNNLGLIIVDEEHESSFKQYDPAPRYNARDMAYILASNFKANLLLGTATPSLETYFNVLQKKLALVEMKTRHTKAPLPLMHIVDLRTEHKRQRMRDIFSKTLLEAIEKNLAEKRQIILFQNRRGFSPYLECPDCGYVPECKNCDVSLTYHKFSNSLMCHHCGYAIPFSSECPECHNRNMRLVGFGTEKIEDTLHEMFPDVRLARMDLDTTRGKDAYSNLISRFENHDIDILIGTQMITKGLDFENVGLVGILSADGMLRLPDFRADERAFQLMVQVAGRAGRSEKQGDVYIQTFQAEHPIIQYVKENNYQSMLDTQMTERKNFWYPPFTRLIKVTIKNRDKDTAVSAAKQLATDLREIKDIVILGPEFPPIARIQLLYAQDILLKIPRQLNFTNIRKQVSDRMQTIVSREEYKTTTFSVNVDPY